MDFQKSCEELYAVSRIPLTKVSRDESLYLPCPPEMMSLFRTGR